MVRGAAGAHAPVDIAQLGCRARFVRQLLDALVKFGKPIHGVGRDEVFPRTRPGLYQRDVDLRPRQAPALR